MRPALFAVLIGAAFPAAAQPAVTPTRQCLSAIQIVSTSLTDAHEIIARVGTTRWRNAANGCDALQSGRGFRLQSTQAQYCSGDIVAVFEPATRFEYGSCTLGTWEKVPK